MPRIDWSLPRLTEHLTKENVFLNFCISHGLDQLVTSPTRRASGNLLDLALTNIPELVSRIEVVPPPFSSDHDAVDFDINTSSPPNDSTPRHDYRRADYPAICERLDSVPWDSYFSNSAGVQQMFDSLRSYLLHLVRLHVPISAFPRPGNSTQKAISSNIRTLEGLLRESSDPGQRDKLQKKIARAHLRQRILRGSSPSIRNASEFFAYVNGRLHTHDSIATLEVASKVVTAPNEQAEAFRAHFGNVFQESVIAVSNETPPPALSGSPDLSVENVLAKLLSLKSKSSLTPDLWPPLFLKNIAPSIAYPVHLILTKSFTDK